MFPCSDDYYGKYKPAINSRKVSNLSRLNDWTWDKFNSRTSTKEFQYQRFSSSSRQSKKPSSIILPFIKSTLDQPRGPNHYWLNKFEGIRNLLKKSGTFLVLTDHFLESSATNHCDNAVWSDRVKLLQQRFPQLCVMGFQSNGLTCSSSDRTNLIQLILKENITFPILLSNKNFYEISNGPCYILFKDFKNPAFYPAKDLDFEALHKAVEELILQRSGNSSPSGFVFNAYSKQDEIVKEPNLWSLRNFPFFFPGCISADRGGDRLFVSDSNNHRIVILNRSGKVLDCVCMKYKTESISHVNYSVVHQYTSAYSKIACN